VILLKDLSKIEGKVLLFQDNQFTLQTAEGSIRMIDLKEIYAVYPLEEDKESLAKIEDMGVKNNWHSESSLILFENDQISNGTLKFYQNGSIYFELNDSKELKILPLNQIVLICFYSKEIMEKRRKKSESADQKKDYLEFREKIEKSEKNPIQSLDIFIQKNKEKIVGKIQSFIDHEFIIKTGISAIKTLSLEEISYFFPEGTDEKQIANFEKQLIDKNKNFLVLKNGTKKEGSLVQFQSGFIYWKKKDEPISVYSIDQISFIYFSVSETKGSWKDIKKKNK